MGKKRIIIVLSMIRDFFFLENHYFLELLLFSCEMSYRIVQFEKLSWEEEKERMKLGNRLVMMESVNRNPKLNTKDAKIFFISPSIFLVISVDFSKFSSRY